MADITETDHTASACPLCKADLDGSPEGEKIYECPNHGEMILSVHLLTDTDN